ncbi:MAG: Beta-lactamase class C-like and penicillin binding proteins (PBPs) superfamily, partial [uncultured Gemmatimonadetes bacterium]
GARCADGGAAPVDRRAPPGRLRRRPGGARESARRAGCPAPAAGRHPALRGGGAQGRGAPAAHGAAGGAGWARGGGRVLARRRGGPAHQRQVRLQERPLRAGWHRHRRGEAARGPARRRDPARALRARHRSAQARHHRGAPGVDDGGAGEHLVRQLRRMGGEPRLGARRAPPPAGGRARRADDLQHRQHAPPFRRPDARHRHQHLGVRGGEAGRAAGHRHPPLAARPAGDLLRRQRHVPDAARHARVRRAVPQRRGARGPAGRPARVGERVHEAARRLRLQRLRLRLRLVAAPLRPARDLFRLGLRRPVHLRGAVPRHDRRLHLHRRGPARARPPPRHPRHRRRAARPRGRGGARVAGEM